jgi:SHS2 domain-containing protein
MPDFEILEHTADAGIVAHGATLAEAFAHTAEGMYALMVDLDGVREAEARETAASGQDLPRLLANWLLELLFLTETEAVFHRFGCVDAAMRLRATAHGRPIGQAARAGRRHQGRHAPPAGGRAGRRRLPDPRPLRHVAMPQAQTKHWRDMLERVDEYRWELPADYKPGMRVPARIYADEALLDIAGEEQAIEQAANVATLPGIVWRLAMPDIHWGYGFLAGVAAMRVEDGVVSPAASASTSTGYAPIRTDSRRRRAPGACSLSTSCPRHPRRLAPRPPPSPSTS